MSGAEGLAAAAEKIPEALEKAAEKANDLKDNLSNPAQGTSQIDRGELFEKGAQDTTPGVWNDIPDISQEKDQGELLNSEDTAAWQDIPDVTERPHDSQNNDDSFWGGSKDEQLPVSNDDGLLSGDSTNYDIQGIDKTDLTSKSVEDKSDTSIDGEKNFNISDDNGVAFKDSDGNLRPNTEFEVNGNHYTTDDQGRPVSWKAVLKNTPEERESSANAAQQEAGGNDRLKGDDGGHLVAHMNGGSSGSENLVPMREHLNRGDYRKGELEENQMLQDGKNVQESGKVNYESDSKRPSTIEKSYTDGEKTVDTKYDNREGSTELLDELKEDISKEDYQSLTDEITDLKDDNHNVSITSVEKHYDSEGKLSKVTVGVRDETTGDKEYKNYTPEQKGNENAAA